MKYYLIETSEDGSYITEYKTKEELLKDLNDEEIHIQDYNDAMPRSDFNYWTQPKMIIKGEIIVPKVKKHIEELDI